MAGLALVRGKPRTTQTVLPAIYVSTYVVSGTISTGTPVTLPSSQTYNSSELEVFLNGQLLALTYDYAYVGSVPRTQISFTFDLVDDDKITFQIMRDQ